MKYETIKELVDHNGNKQRAACRTLGVTIETTSVSQAKGQIERANGTFQERLVNELRLEGIDSIKEANRYLYEVFVPDFNSRFAEDPSTVPSVMEQAPDSNRINQILAVLSPRKFDNGSSVKYFGQYYQAYDEDHQLICFKPKTRCLVIRAFDGELYVTVDEKVYLLLPCTRKKKVSEQFDTAQQEPKKRKQYIPPMTHPWKIRAFLDHREKAHNSHVYA